MTHEDITRMARESGFVGMDGEHGALRRFAAIVATAEREAIVRRVAIALLGADCGLTNRVNKAIQSKGV